MKNSQQIGCCGADGPMDYHNLLKPLPAECRDTVTGNAFFHGCVDQLTWYLEDRSYWIVVLTLMLCALHVRNHHTETIFVYNSLTSLFFYHR